MEQAHKLLSRACGLKIVRTQEICSMALVPVRSPVRRYASAASTASVPIDTYTASRPLGSCAGRLLRYGGVD